MNKRKTPVLKIEPKLLDYTYNPISAESLIFANYTGIKSEDMQFLLESNALKGKRIA